MAYQVIDPIDLAPLAASASYPITLSTLGLTLVDDDYLLVGVVFGTAAGTLSVAGSGWSEIIELDVTSAHRMALYKCKVASGAAADPTISISTGTGIWQAFLMQWRDAEATNFNLTAQTAEANAVSVASATYTPSENDCTILYFGATRTGSGINSCRFLSDKVVGNLMRSFDDNSTFIGYALGTVQQATAAATAQTMYGAMSTRLGVITLAIKNKTNGGKSADCRSSMTKVGWFGDYGTAHESLGSLTMNAPSTFCVWSGGTEAISGVNLATGTSAIDNTIQGLPPFTGRYSQFSTTGVAAEWAGNWWALPSTLDMTGKIFTLEWFMTNVGSQIGSQGVVIAFGDDSAADTGNAALFKLASKQFIPASTLCVNHIAVDAATPYAAVGSINWASIDKIGIFMHRSGTSGTRTISFRNLYLHGSSDLVGGASGRPLNIKFLDFALNGWGYTGMCNKQGDAVMVKTSVRFGDGTVATYVDTTATLLNTPQLYSTFAQPFWNVPANEITIGMKAASGDTMRFVASAMAAGLGAEQNFTIDSATSASATYSFAGEVISNFLFTGDTDVPIVGATYSGDDEVAFGGADVTSVTVTDTTSTDAACSFDADGSVVLTSTIDGTGALYAIELGASVTAITLTDCTITAGSTDKVHVLKTLTNVAAGAFVVGVHYRINTVGTTDFTAIGASANTIGINFTATGAGSGTGNADEAVKITISGSTSLAEADVTTAGAPAWVAAPELYQSVAITGLATTYRLQIFDIEYDLTVSGITVTPTAGATYTHNGITWTVRSASITAGAGTVTVYGTGTPATSGTLTKASGTGDASIAFSAYAVGGTELYIGVPAATSYTWTDSVAASSPRVIRVRVMEDGPGTSDAIIMIDAIVGMCGIMEGSESVAYLVAAVADDVYNDRGVDGSTITGITIDDTTLRLEIASGTITNYNGTDVLVVDGRDLYAYETYWLGTTAGMRDEARFIEAVDPVNFRCSGFKLKGTSGYPILIRNCYLVDAETSIFASLVDYSGDPISNAPDHMAAIVVSTSDSVVTGTLDEFIAAVPTAASVATEVWSKTLPL